MYGTTNWQLFPGSWQLFAGNYSTQLATIPPHMMSTIHARAAYIFTYFVQYYWESSIFTVYTK